jgi:hypothetical protein
MSKSEKQKRHGVHEWRLLSSCKEFTTKRVMWIVPGAASLAIIGGVLYNSPVYIKLFPADEGSSSEILNQVKIQNNNLFENADKESASSLRVEEDSSVQSPQVNGRYTGPEHNSNAIFLRNDYSCSERKNLALSHKDSAISAQYKQYQQQLSYIASLYWTGKISNRGEYENIIKNEKSKHRDTLKNIDSSYRNNSKCAD